ncbi:tetratricopeptide repeat protein [Kitasatospora sp. DSM 101779]|uniref:tetratricopeptide repeat protein n=1 Tax=Kitasatospora sp. DSM 101779 TaxID=2853165 RepID=UPI0021D8CE24|nr:tetratricopeptide repeat protein [Kitasatospora sp. DSM 101779]MCU7820642.1 tetratricopeptide repeat protein [Kitasatospora sp. DSM 101779]
MAHGEHGDGQLEARGEVALARLALDAGDLAHAAAHLAEAVVHDPQQPDLHEALAELCALAGGAAAARTHFPLDGEVYLGTLVCRAHVEAAAGDWDNAVGLLAAAIGFEPSRPWAHAAWLAREDLPDLVDPQSAAEAVPRALGGLPDPLPEEMREAVRPFDAFVRAAVRRHPDHALLLALASGLVRLSGDTAEAVRLAERAHRLAPGHVAAVMLGNALRAHGDPDRALAVWEAELARDPSDSHLAVDVAELYGATGRPAEGLRWLDRVLAADPDHPRAAPARHGLRHRIDGGTAHLLALADHHREHPDHEYAPDLLAHLARQLPWLGMVPGTGETTVNVLHRLLESPGTGRGGGPAIAVPRLEAPSAVTAVRLALPAADVAFREVPEPDPRVPLRPVATRVWSWRGTDPVPAVPPPSAAAAELVRDTAEVVWPSPPAAYDHAVRLAGLGPADLLGVLAHPPAPRADELGRALLAHQPELWVRAVQSFACLGLAHHRTDEAWEGSRRRELLLDLLHGAEDWTVEAAGFALVAVAWTLPETRADIAERLVERLHHAAAAARSRDVAMLPSLCALVLACPWADPAALDLARSLTRTAPAATAAPDDGALAPVRRRGLLRRLFGRR